MQIAIDRAAAVGTDFAMLRLALLPHRARLSRNARGVAKWTSQTVGSGGLA
jgi:hypothetical protein